MKRGREEIKMASAHVARNVFTLLFSDEENGALSQIAKLTTEKGIIQLCFDIPVDPERFVSRFPASFVYFVEHYNAYGIMRFRGLGSESNVLRGDWIEDTSKVSDMNAMSKQQLASTLFLGTIDPFLYCRGDIVGILAFFELVTKALEGSFLFLFLFLICFRMPKSSRPSSK